MHKIVLEFIKEHGFSDYFVADLLFEDTKVIFILESPHVDEVKSGYPVAGKSGRDMSKILLQESEFSHEPFGKVIYEEKIRGFGIINVSNIPLQESAYALRESAIFDTLRLFRQNPLRRKKDAPVNRVIDVIYEDFRERVSPHRDKKIVLCGTFAAKIFNELFQKSDFNAVIEVPHPSFNNWSKEKYRAKIDALV